MKILSVQLKNFKRFTDLSIEQIPESSKLVLLIGANGSGKSSVFDGFGFINNDIRLKKNVKKEDVYVSYFQKDKAKNLSVDITFDNGKKYSAFHGSNSVSWQPNNIFYGRTSLRQTPRLTRKNLGEGDKYDLKEDSDRPIFFIDRDIRFENDIEKITEVLLREFFIANESTKKIRKKYIAPINSSLENILGTSNGTKLELLEIIPPLEGKVAQITFQKGNSKFHYNYLSAGEKEVFNILINLLSRRDYYQDTIYFFDEIDLHLNTKLQFNLLKEITENWIPEKCQLWTASHSLGFIEYAKQSDWASIIDFDNYDFDLPKILTPEPKENSDLYEIAVGKEFLPALFRSMNIFFVENRDKIYYAELGIENTIFVSDNNRNSVFHKVRSSDYHGIVDRDYLSDEDINVIQSHYPKLIILNYYSIENYLYHPDNLEEYYEVIKQPFEKEEYIKQLVAEKNIVKANIILAISLKRTEYPYFKESEYNKKKDLQDRFKNRGENMAESMKIANYLESNELESFYKVLPMKTYCTQLTYRQNIPKNELVKTNWFKQKMEVLINTKH